MDELSAVYEWLGQISCGVTGVQMSLRLSAAPSRLMCSTQLLHKGLHAMAGRLSQCTTHAARVQCTSHAAGLHAEGYLDV